MKKSFRTSYTPVQETVFVADDGSSFKTEAECLEYEQQMQNVLEIKKKILALELGPDIPTYSDYEITWYFCETPEDADLLRDGLVEPVCRQLEKDVQDYWTDRLPEKFPQWIAVGEPDYPDEPTQDMGTMEDYLCDVYEWIAQMHRSCKGKDCKSIAEFYAKLGELLAKDSQDMGTHK